MELERHLNLTTLLARKSSFLFGPRATGKSTLIRQQLSESATVIDLLDSRMYMRLIGSRRHIGWLLVARLDKFPKTQGDQKG